MLRCPNCDSKNVKFRVLPDRKSFSARCEDCDHTWEDSSDVVKPSMPGLTLFFISAGVAIILLAIISVTFLIMWLKQNGLV